MSQGILPLMFLRPRCLQSTSPLSWTSRCHPVKMPLKAKITNPAFSTQSRRMAGRPPAQQPIDEQSIPSSQPGDDPDDVLFNTLYGVRTIELNRPKKLNSLNGSMARKIIPRLLEWEKSQMANVILINGAGPKAFCAGGDVAALAKMNRSGPDGPALAQQYFALEYQLDHVIATYSKPYIAYMDGITMGGGVGLSVHAPIRIATERTLFAMPETTIGFFPDVGGSFFLPRLEGMIGTYLGLTSERLKGVNAFYAGIATHYIDSSSLANLTARLSELQFKDYEDMHTRLATIDATIAEFDTGLPHDEPMLIAGELRNAIDRCFRYTTMEEIIDALKQEEQRGPETDPANIRAWATKTLQTLSERSPTSLKVTLRQMQLGKKWDIAETFQHEYELAGKMMSHPDFNNGVTARLIDEPRTAPKWDPPAVEQVSDSDVDKLYAKTKGSSRLELLRPHGLGSYNDYEFRMGLPREEEVEKLVREGGMRATKVVQHFLRAKNDRIGVREKVGEILARRCGRHPEGDLVWLEEGE